jgi:hypothetical protein
VVAERLSSLDQSFLCLEGADTPMRLGAVLVFRPVAGVAEVLRTRAAVPGLRRRLGYLDLHQPWLVSARH